MSLHSIEPPHDHAERLQGAVDAARGRGVPSAVTNLIIGTYFFPDLMPDWSVAEEPSDVAGP